MRDSIRITTRLYRDHSLITYFYNLFSHPLKSDYRLSIMIPKSFGVSAWLLYGALLLILIDTFSLAQDVTTEDATATTGNATAADAEGRSSGSSDSSPASFKEFKEAAQTGDIKCYICNTMIGECINLEGDNEPKSCNTEYFQTVYGAGSLDLPETFEFSNWPPTKPETPAGSPKPRESSGSQSNETADTNTTGTGVTGGGGNPPTSPPKDWSTPRLSDGPENTETQNRFSGFGNMNKTKWQGGFKSCYTMTITAIAQQNGGHRAEISSKAPRIIRGCSFVGVADKTSKDSFNSKACRTFNYKSAQIEVCYCDDPGKDKKGGCNGSSYLRGTKWMLVLTLLWAFIKIFDN